MVVAGLVGGESSNNVLQSFGDATAGRSLFLYYGCAATDSGGTSYVLSRDVGTSQPAYISSSQTISFDVTINKATVFSGIGYMDCFIQIGAAGDNLTHAHARLYHRLSGVDTAICSEVVTANISTNSNLKLRFNVSKKNFKPGSVLRLTVEFTLGVAAVGAFSFDPSSAGGELKLWMPVVNLE